MISDMTDCRASRMPAHSWAQLHAATSVSVFYLVSACPALSNSGCRCEISLYVKRAGSPQSEIRPWCSLANTGLEADSQRVEEARICAVWQFVHVRFSACVLGERDVRVEQIASREHVPNRDALGGVLEPHVQLNIGPG